MGELVKLRKHQLETVSLADLLNEWGLFHDPGTGKTGTTITIVRNKMNRARRFLRTLILVPPIGVKQWKREWGKFSKVPPASVVLLRGEGRKRLATFQKLAYRKTDLGDIPDGKIFITNYESLLMRDLFQAMVDWAPEVLVIDESHYVKNPQAKRSKILEYLANPQRKNPELRFEKKPKPAYAIRKNQGAAPFKYILTGTPATNSPMDLFQQFLILDGGETFGQNFFVFRSRFFLDKNAGMPKQKYFPDWQLRPGAMEEMNKLIFTKANYVRKEECLDLPPLIQTPVYVEMTPEQRRMYEEMKRDLITVIKDTACTAQLAITKALRLQQMASGFVKTVDGVEHPIEGNPKEAALSELLEKLLPTGKVIVWCAWSQNYGQVEKVCDALGVKHTKVVGGMSETARTKAVEDFTKGDARVMYANAKAAGMSIDLIEAPYAIYFSRTFSLIDEIQSRARNYRGGSEMHKSIVHYRLITEGTIDELTDKRLEAKEEMTLELLRKNIEEL